METKSFYNTLRLDFPEVQIEEEKAKNGDALVYEIFKLNPESELTPYEVLDLVNKGAKQYDRNSVRRSITNLTTKGLLIKTDKQKKECKGTNNFLWRLKNAKE